MSGIPKYRTRYYTSGKPGRPKSACGVGRGEVDPALWVYEREHFDEVPERLLWMAVAENAIRDAAHYRRQLCGIIRFEHSRAFCLAKIEEIWCWAYDDCGPGSLLWIAEHVCDDPGWFIQKVRRAL